MPDDIGSLEVGRKADIVIRSNDMPDALPNADPVYQMMQISRTKSVDTVIIDGEIVLRGGKLTRMDEAYVYAEGRASAARMLDRIDM
jgi:cytosine/adenosine deaminase-related metal-dependent hydrolase